MEAELYNKIINGNVDVHRIEAPFYDSIHPEIFNHFEQSRMKNELKFMHKKIRDNGLRALDIGCGTGNVTLKLARLGYRVSGIDISTSMLDILNKKIRSMGLEKEIRLINANIDDFLKDPQDRNYDIITISSVLHHLPEYLSTLSNLLNNIKKGGFLFIVHEPTANFFQPEDKISRKCLRELDWRLYFKIHKRSIPKNVPPRDWSFSDYHVYNGFSEQKVRDLLLDNRFNILRFQKYGAVMNLGVSNFIDTYLFNVKSHFTIIAQKE